MIADRIRAIAAATPWLPHDYLRHLARVEPGSGAHRYGAQWFDGPQQPEAVYGAHVGAQFPGARLIARRHGSFIGYCDWERGYPRLREWAGSQQGVLHEFADIGTLVLSSILSPGYDSRPVVAQPLSVAGLAIGPWHDARSVLIARCIMLPGGELGVLEAMQAASPGGWELQLMQEDGDSARSIRPAAGGLEWCLDRHGSFGAWQSVSHAAAAAAVLLLAPFNDGSQPGYHAKIARSVPLPP